LVFGQRVADDIAGVPVPARITPTMMAPSVPGRDAAADVAGLTAQLRALMYEKVGLRRDGPDLAAALAAHAAIAHQISAIANRAGPAMPAPEDVRRWGELCNMALAARFTTLAASRRLESRGAHCRIDFPQPAAAVGLRQFLTIEDLSETATPFDSLVPAATREGHHHDHATALSA
jgi:L-aspartate oxidase